MPITERELRDWIEDQVGVLLDCGYSYEEAEEAVSSLLDELPVGQDPRAYFPTRTDEYAAVIEADQERARRHWRESDGVPTEFKLLLDALPLPRKEG